jgi:hypothetical protein
MRVALGLPASAVAAALGLSERAVELAEKDRVGGGRGCVSQHVHDRIERFLLERQGGG